MDSGQEKISSPSECGHLFPIVGEGGTGRPREPYQASVRIRVNHHSTFSEGTDEFAASTIDSKRKRLTQLKGIIYDLKEQGKFSTVSPRYFTTKDISCLLGYRKSKVDIATVLKDVSALEGFLKFCGNDVFEKFRDEYPRFIPKRHQKRKPSMPYEHVHRIVEYANGIDVNDHYRMRSFAVVMFCLCGGLRNLELRYAKLSNLSFNDNGIKIWLEDVIGKGTYGEARYVPFLPFGREFIERYLRSRDVLLKELGLQSDALIPSLYEEYEFTSSKNLRKPKDHAMRDVGFKFDLRILRRTYGQYLVDSEVRFEIVQVAMGHSSPDTTFQNYAGVRTERVPDLVFKGLLENKEKNRKEVV